MTELKQTIDYFDLMADAMTLIGDDDNIPAALYKAKMIMQKMYLYSPTLLTGTWSIKMTWSYSVPICLKELR